LDFRRCPVESTRTVPGQGRLPSLMFAVLVACASEDARPPVVVSATQPREPPAKAPPPRLRKLFVADQPSTFAAAADIALGAPAEEVRRAVPAFFGPTPFRPEGFDDVTLSA